MKMFAALVAVSLMASAVACHHHGGRDKVIVVPPGKVKHVPPGHLKKLGLEPASQPEKSAPGREI